MKIYSDKELKDQGNKYFNANKYESAIESYSKAIALKPKCSNLLHQQSSMLYEV